MPDERRISRKEPISVTIDAIDYTFVAKPLQWRERIDFGNVVGAQYENALNIALERLRNRDQNPADVGKIMEAEIDYLSLFQKAFPEESPENFEKLDYDEVLEVLRAALDVNRLGKMFFMLDPNLPTPDENSGITPGDLEDGQKTTSGEDSSLPELVSTT